MTNFRNTDERCQDAMNRAAWWYGRLMLTAYAVGIPTFFLMMFGFMADSHLGTIDWPIPPLTLAGGLISLGGVTLTHVFLPGTWESILQSTDAFCREFSKGR